MKGPLRLDFLDLTFKELEKAGVKVTVDKKRRHLKLKWRVGDGPERTLVAPRNPSDYRTRQNMKTNVRRLLRQDGIGKNK